MIDLFRAAFVPTGGPLRDMSPQGCAVQCPACRRVYVEVLYVQFVLIASNALRSSALQGHVRRAARLLRELRAQRGGCGLRRVALRVGGQGRAARAVLVHLRSCGGR